MSTDAPQPCIRGCVTRRKHLNTCPAADHTDGAWITWRPTNDKLNDICDADRALLRTNPAERSTTWISRYGALETWHPCNGCQPRAARHGLLCPTCHLQLNDWLTGQRGLAWVYRWLGQNLSRNGTSAARQDWQRTGSADEGAPLPIREAVHDLRVLLSDRVYIADERTREVFDRPAAQSPFNLGTSLAFLSAWQPKIETDPDLVTLIYDRFHDTMRDAALIAPWGKAPPRRVIGVPCPECDLDSLVQHAGEDSVACNHCGALLSPQRYASWTAMLAAHATRRRRRETA